MTTGFHMITPENSSRFPYSPIPIRCTTFWWIRLPLPPILWTFRTSSPVPPKGSPPIQGSVALPLRETQLPPESAKPGNTSSLSIWRQTHGSRDTYSRTCRPGCLAEGTVKRIHGPMQNGNFETALAIAKSLDQSVKNPHTPWFAEHSNALSPQPLLQYKIAEDWFSAHWFGEFFDTDSGWIFHYDLGWLFSENSGEEGDWYWSKNKGWILKESSLLLLHNKRRIFYDSNNLLTYDYSTRQWTLWDDLIRVQIEGKEARASNRICRQYGSVIENILNSNLSDDEKIDGIADMILFGI